MGGRGNPSELEFQPSLPANETLFDSCLRQRRGEGDLMPQGRTQVIHDAETLLTLGALGQSTASIVNTKTDGSNEQGIKLKTLKGAMYFDGKTTAEGPIAIGIAAGLSASEIAEAFTADPQRHEDPNASEAANRKVFPIWLISRRSTQSNDDISDNVRSIRDLRAPTWTLDESEALVWFAFNYGAALTTGTIIRLTSHRVIDWERD